MAKKPLKYFNYLYLYYHHTALTYEYIFYTTKTIFNLSIDFFPILQLYQELQYSCFMYQNSMKNPFTSLRHYLLQVNHEYFSTVC